MESQARRFSYPWRCSLTVFAAGPQTADLRPVWQRLAQATLGGNPYGPATGVAVLEKTAAETERRGSRYDVAPIRTGLEAAIRFRRDNARHLREQFPGEADLARAADLFDRAAERYQAALDAVADGVGDPAEARQVATWLREAAAAEREAGPGRSFRRGGSECDRTLAWSAPGLSSEQLTAFPGGEATNLLCNPERRTL